MKATLTLITTLCIIGCGEDKYEKTKREGREALEHKLDSIDRSTDLKLRQYDDTILLLKAGADIKELRK